MFFIIWNVQLLLKFEIVQYNIVRKTGWTYLMLLNCDWHALARVDLWIDHCTTCLNFIDVYLFLVRDEIRTVIGQTKLVINERFSQFSKLIDRADGSGDSSSDQLPVLLSDLQGFWDMIYFQVRATFIRGFFTTCIQLPLFKHLFLSSKITVCCQYLWKFFVHLCEVLVASTLFLFSNFSFTFWAFQLLHSRQVAD